MHIPEGAKDGPWYWHPQVPSDLQQRTTGKNGWKEGQRSCCSQVEASGGEHCLGAVGAVEQEPLAHDPELGQTTHAAAPLPQLSVDPPPEQWPVRSQQPLQVAAVQGGSASLADASPTSPSPSAPSDVSEPSGASDASSPASIPALPSFALESPGPGALS
jgi:hypothetical protein